MKSEPNVLGIDHPVIAARELERACHVYKRLGFTLSPRGQHPWGTANHLIMFQRDFIELLGVYDPVLLSQEISPNSQVYSGFVRDFLARREGFSLMALHSDDIERDQQRVEARGLEGARRIEFRRAVVLPDGGQDEAVVSLAMLIQPAYPNLSTFICQQHKPQLVWVPAWCEHPNKADGIRGVTYVADEPDAVTGYYQALYGAERVHRTMSGLEVNTPNGIITILSSAVVGSRYPEFEGLLPAPEDRPCGIAISVHTQDLNAAMDCLVRAGVPFVRSRENTVRVGPEQAYGIVLELVGD
ncbi:MAG: VOC family protein [Candidatus Competibacteraceae bacterium]|nr:VOC family protein [Candidatus Competibacteraceae bacterium]